MGNVTLEKIQLKEEKELFFSYPDEPQELGCIGHLRGDFGNGKSFYSTWFPHKNEHLNNEYFKTIFNAVIEELRENGNVLSERSAMYNFCSPKKDCSINGIHKNMTWGFRIETQDFLIYLRCSPVYGDYNFYAYCYDKNMLLDKLAGDRGLPRYCYAHLPTTGEDIRIDFATSGYTPCGKLARDVKEINKALDVTLAQAEALKAGSMFGWDVPAADPKNYDENGKPKPITKKRTERGER